MKDYYEILGVSPLSDEVVIRAAFKALMLKYHPDTNKSSNATARAAEINEAFHVIGNAERRAEYDARRTARNSSQRGSAKAEPKKPDARTEQPKPTPKPPKPAQQAKATQRPQSTRIDKSVGILCVAIVLACIYAVAVSTDKSNDGNSEHAASQTSSEASNEANLTTASEPFDGSENITQSAPSNDSASQDNVDERNILKAAKEFDRILKSSGMVGAEAYSRKCHAAALQSGKWRDFDFCSAFNYAAAYVDRSVTNGSGMPINQYFSVITDPKNRESLYALDAGMGYLAQDRSSTIQQLAIQSIEEIVLSSNAAN
ncbi:J domain-containing protein [Sphingobium sp. KCTC 72723]|uniref:J domain-containing protein n=1 Tax=Sphingobium sp. KCTC 72723 TaxID=2733867 RepID=UPI00165D41DF|nr:DnaJ domain-containing protein [Sphingobium sp. KCTC 72723]